MKTKKLLFRVMAACLMGVLAAGCGRANERPDEETVSKSLDLAVYASVESDGKFAPLDSALLRENVSVEKLLHYDRDGDFITVPFHFTDSVEYAKITEANIGKHIVITADGEVVSTPIVKMRIGNGACSFLLSKEQAEKLFPKEKIEKLLKRE